MTSTRTFELDLRVRRAFDAGDLRAAAECIVDALGADLVRIIHARFRDEQLTAEVFSRVAEDLWVGLPTFTFRCSVRAWVFTLARNAGSRYLDRELRRERSHVPLSRAPELADAVQRSFAQTFSSSTDPADRLAALRAELDEDDQLLLTLRIDRELDFREIAVVMLGDADADRAAVVREAARLRKRFQTLKERLRARWQASKQR